VITGRVSSSVDTFLGESSILRGVLNAAGSGGVVGSVGFLSSVGVDGSVGVPVQVGTVWGPGQ
jgi:hypothetical protein